MGCVAWLVSQSETNFEPSFSYFLCVKKFCCYQILRFKFCKFSECCFPVSWGYCSDCLVWWCWHRVCLFCEHRCVWWHDTHCSAITFHSGTVHMPLGHKSTRVKSSFPSPLLTCWDCSDDKMKSDVAVRHVALWTPLSYPCVAAVYRAPGELPCSHGSTTHGVCHSSWALPWSRENSQRQAVNEWCGCKLVDTHIWIS